MKKIFALLLALVIVISLAACGSGTKNITGTKPETSNSESKDGEAKSGGEKTEGEQQKVSDNTGSSQGTSNIGDTNKSTPVGQLKVHFIDVGQADSILVQDGTSTMLIDAGNNDDDDIVVNYIKGLGISRLDYVVATHPHEDHIGGLDAVIDSFDIGTVFMPRKTSTTNTFEDVINSMKNKGLKATAPVPGKSFTLPGSICTIMAPNSSDYEDINDYSVVIKLVHGGVSFLFTGDAGAVSEMEIVKRGFNINATVLKVGHHGSRTSSTANFLKAVKPKYAVISVGKGNDYGHPTKEALSRIRGAGAKIYRTDESGTIVATSDKNEVTFNRGPSANTSGGDSSAGENSAGSTAQAEKNVTPAPVPFIGSKNRMVYFTPSGKSYHYDRNCRTLARSKTVLEGTLNDAVSKGKSDPCNECVN